MQSIISLIMQRVFLSLLIHKSFKSKIIVKNISVFLLYQMLEIFFIDSYSNIILMFDLKCKLKRKIEIILPFDLFQSLSTSLCSKFMKMPIIFINHLLYRILLIYKAWLYEVKSYLNYLSQELFLRFQSLLEKISYEHQMQSYFAKISYFSKKEKKYLWSWFFAFERKIYHHL